MLQVTYVPEPAMLTFTSMLLLTLRRRRRKS